MGEDRSDEVSAAIAALAASLARRFDALEAWLEVGEPLWSLRPEPDSWSIGETCEHVTLMQRYVLKLVDKIARRALALRAEGELAPATLGDHDDLVALARSEFRWDHPEHMTPTGDASREALSAELAQQRRRCLAWLTRLPHGEGGLHAIGMSVVGRKLDLYGYLRLIELHLDRHLRQMQRTHERLSAGRPDVPRRPGPPGP